MASPTAVARMYIAMEVKNNRLLTLLTLVARLQMTTQIVKQNKTVKIPKISLGTEILEMQ